MNIGMLALSVPWQRDKLCHLPLHMSSWAFWHFIAAEQVNALCLKTVRQGNELWKTRENVRVEGVVWRVQESQWEGERINYLYKQM